MQMRWQIKTNEQMFQRYSNTGTYKQIHRAGWRVFTEACKSFRASFNNSLLRECGFCSLLSLLSGCSLTLAVLRRGQQLSELNLHLKKTKQKKPLVCLLSANKLNLLCHIHSNYYSKCLMGALILYVCVGKFKRKSRIQSFLHDTYWRP